MTEAQTSRTLFGTYGEIAELFDNQKITTYSTWKKHIYN